MTNTELKKLGLEYIEERRHRRYIKHPEHDLEISVDKPLSKLSSKSVLWDLLNAMFHKGEKAGQLNKLYEIKRVFEIPDLTENDY